MSKYFKRLVSIIMNDDSFPEVESFALGAPRGGKISQAEACARKYVESEEWQSKLLHVLHTAQNNASKLYALWSLKHKGYPLQQLKDDPDTILLLNDKTETGFLQGCIYTTTTIAEIANTIMNTNDYDYY
eukprot:TRINITY_DN4555_c1_g1_i1.p1 TRINITY_DN4555_c1_g1~~TRINITY_DN4555_c1_g1_i1.p1  ORF type:complete len:130 (+),score=20.78 TRINITY_DN4555_c1_g1_i1:51-440(+)